MSEDLARLRRRLLTAALRHVPFDGWSRRTLSLAAVECGVDATTLHRTFPRGAAGLLDFFAAEADRRMVAALEGIDLAALPSRDRIATAVRLRLEQNAEYREAIRRALAASSLPGLAGGGAASLARTVDLIWRAAGDRATDFNFYTKRALLAGVYLSTVIYWLDDRSPGCAATWAFLDRRIDDVMRVQQARGRLDELATRYSPLKLVFPGLRAGTG